jgi:hypothetical protein
MELEGKIIQINPPQSGEGKNGSWKKQEYIIETKSQYPKKVCAVAWGDKIDQFALQLNEDVVLSIELESREYNSRWYTDVRIWRVSRSTTSQDAAMEQPDDTPPSGNDLESDELPF